MFGLLVAACGWDGRDTRGAREDVGSVSLETIYGNDDRQEPFEADIALRNLAERAVVALLPASASPWDAPPSRERHNLCSDVRFADQPAAAACSGVLIERDLVLTAGHCARGLDCSTMKVVFGFFFDGPNEPHAVEAADVYQCREVVAYEIPSAIGELDFGWIRLDRAVNAERAPARIATESWLSNGDAVRSVGFPGGVPMKVHGDGHVTEARQEAHTYFVTDLDLFAGNSGSPVVDGAGEVVGIVGSGADDYVCNGELGCCRPQISVAGQGVGERATYADRALDALHAASEEASPADHESIVGCGLTIGGPPIGSPAALFALALAVGAFGARSKTRASGLLGLVLSAWVHRRMVRRRRRPPVADDTAHDSP